MSGIYFLCDSCEIIVKGKKSAVNINLKVFRALTNYIVDQNL